MDILKYLKKHFDPIGGLRISRYLEVILNIWKRKF